MKRFMSASWMALICLGGGLAASGAAQAADGPTLFDPATSPQPIQHTTAMAPGNDSEITIRPSNRRAAAPVSGSVSSRDANIESVPTASRPMPVAARPGVSQSASRRAVTAASTSQYRRVVSQYSKRPAAANQRASGELVTARSIAPQNITPQRIASQPVAGQPIPISAGPWQSPPAYGMNAGYGPEYYGDAPWSGSPWPGSLQPQHYNVSYGIPSPVIVPMASAGYGQCPPWRPCGPGNSWGGNRGFQQGFYGADFRPACAQHDACLAGNCSRRIDCDREFLANMCAACETSDRPALCRAKARQYYLGTRLFGGFYR